VQRRTGDEGWTWFSVALVSALFVADVVVAQSLVLLGAMVIGPLLAASFASARATALVGVYAVVLGVLAGPFDEIWGTSDHFVRVTVLAMGSALAVFAARRRADRERALAEVTRVAEVAQRTILRTLPGELGPVCFAARYVSASHEALVGGDFYDAVETPYGVRAIVGDVRGKGLDAVNLAAAVLGSFREAAFVHDSLAEAAAVVDRSISRALENEDFVSAVFVEFIDETRFRVVNCGHPPPLLVGRESVRFVEAQSSCPLGFDPTFEVLEAQMQPGERLLLYTDGLVEARDGRGSFFPLEASAGSALAQPSLDDAVDGLLEQLRAHVGGQVNDDVAVVVTEPCPS
jgi:phosphoserine phosphatase RsbU/P